MTRLLRPSAGLLCLIVFAGVANAQYGRGGRGNVVTPWGTMSQSQYQMMVFNPEGFEMMMEQRQQAAMLKQFQQLSREQQAMYKNYQQYQKMLDQQNAQNGGANGNLHANVPSNHSKSRVKKKPTTAKKPSGSAVVSTKSVLPKGDQSVVAKDSSKDAKTSSADKLKVFDVKSVDKPKTETAKPTSTDKPKPSSTATAKPKEKPKKKISKPVFDFGADDDTEKKP